MLPAEQLVETNLERLNRDTSKLGNSRLVTYLGGLHGKPSPSIRYWPKKRKLQEICRRRADSNEIRSLLPTDGFLVFWKILCCQHHSQHKEWRARTLTAAISGQASMPLWQTLNKHPRINDSYIQSK